MCNKLAAEELVGEGPVNQFPSIPESRFTDRPCPQCNHLTKPSFRSGKTIWKRCDTADIIHDILDHPGAVYINWDGTYDKYSKLMHFGSDKMSLAVICPGRNIWNIDSRASNCDRKDDHSHRCWVRHGGIYTVEQMHVDKVGHTCGAGAGSIMFPEYHGFLHHGRLTSSL